MTQLNVAPYSNDFNDYCQIADDGRKIIRFKDKDGNVTAAKQIQGRIKDAGLGWDGKLHFKLFSKSMQASYASTEFHNPTGTTYWIYLNVAHWRHLREFEKGDKLVVSGTVSNDGDYTVIQTSESYGIDSFDATNSYIYLDAAEGDRSGDWSGGEVFRVQGAANKANNGAYTVSAVSFPATKTRITVTETITTTEASSNATMKAPRPRILVTESVTDETVAGTIKNTVTTDHMWLDAGETILTANHVVKEAHLLNKDSVGAVAIDMWFEAYSDDDLSGTTIT